MRTPIVGSLVTAAAMLLVGWGVGGVGMAGPRPGARIALLLPQVEVTLLFLAGLPVWTRLAGGGRLAPLRPALAATVHGPERLVWGAAAAHLTRVLALLTGGTVLWLLASRLEAGPSVGSLAAARLLLLAFGVFGVGLGTWAAAISRSTPAARVACFLVVAAMAAAPLAVGPLIAVAGAQRALVGGAMLLNPWIVTGGISGLDVLRMQWIYALSQLGSVEAPYPGLIPAVAAYGAAGALLLALSVRALRRSAPAGRRWPRRAGALAGALLLLAGPGVTIVAAGSGPAAPDVAAAVGRGTAFLVGRQQPDGSWEGHAGFTAVALLALLAPPPDGTPPPAAAAARGLAYLERWVRPDGGIYQEEIRHYTTAVGILAFAASGERRYRERIAAARDYLVARQARDDNGYPPAHPNHGGTLVGGGRTSLDATFFALRALAVAGLPPEHPYWARALRYVERCQNWKAANDQPWATTDGGFVFSPGFSFAGGTTSYGTMTYAGLSAYRDVGLPRDDARVQAAFRWLHAHFTTHENPGLQQQTLYHSYFYLAHTLRRWGVDTFVDDTGRERAWRRELAEALLGRQHGDGSWANTEDPRWYESLPVLATAFAVRALKEVAEPIAP